MEENTKYAIYEYSDYYGRFECLSDISKESAIKLKEKLLEYFDEKLPGFFYRKDMIIKGGDFKGFENDESYFIECDEFYEGGFDYDGYLLVLCPDTDYNMEVLGNAGYSGLWDINFVKAFANMLEMEEVDGEVVA